MAAGFALDCFPPIRLQRLARRLTRMMGRACGPLGLSTPGWRVMALLGQEDSLPLRELQNRSAIARARMSRAVTELCARGYIEPKAVAGDRRRLIVQLTPRGKEVCRDLKRVMLELQSTLAGGIGAEEYSAFERVLDNFEAQIDAAESIAADPVTPAEGAA